MVIKKTRVIISLQLNIIYTIKDYEVWVLNIIHTSQYPSKRMNI
jgi:hypothetical protein